VSPDDARYTCKECAFDVWLPIVELETSTLGLYDDVRFPGRCLLVYHEHVEHLTELTTAAACAFFEDARTAASAILGITGASRMNYAVLGNTEPHLHFHLIPRIVASDPVPTRPPWDHPEQRAPMEPQKIESLRSRLRAALSPERTRRSAGR
jgi:diadenosine tetraphosphate (Ap4A) HIT family hydrolase